MQDYKRTIIELQRDIERNSGEIQGRLKRLGEYLSYQDAGQLPGPESKELHGRVQELRRQLPESRQQVKKILQTVAGNEQLDREIRSGKSRINELSKENNEICEAVGRAAYLAYKNGSIPVEAYRKMFEPLDKQERELVDLEAEQETLQAHDREGKFFKIFRETGRSVYVKGRLSLRRRAVVKLYHEAGKRICSSRSKDELKDGGLQEALAPYTANERKIAAIQREMDKLRTEQEEKWSVLQSMGAHRSHQKRVREIESEIQRIEGQLEDAFEGLGSLYRSKGSGKSEDTEAAGIVNQIREIEQANRKKTKSIERLNAAMQIDSLHAQIGNLSERIAKLEGEIETRRREVETLRTQIAGGEKEIQRLQRIRGSTQSLYTDGEVDGSD